MTKTRMNPARCGTFLAAFLLFFVSAAFLLTGCDHKQQNAHTAAQEKQFYTCGMHPQVVQDHPGNCPICGMKLTPVHKSGAGDSSVIAVDPVTAQNMGVRTATITRGPLRRVIRTVGVIDYNETSLADVTTKFKGWVEKLYVDATGQQVHRGEPLFEIYAPDLYSAQREYLLSLEASTNAPGSGSLRASAFTKLRFFDISPQQIAELERTREPRKTLQVVAPQDGFVTEKTIIEGQMVEAGTKLYRLADLGLVWVQAQIYEQDLAYIHLGQEATVALSYLPDREFRGRVTYIYPNVDEKTRTTRVRMEFHNPGYFLKPGMFATVQVLSELEPSAVLVPDMAILRSGKKNTVFVALEEGKFQPRAIVVGLQAENDMYQVISGLTDGERVVTSAQFMLDSESQLREAIQKMVEPTQSGHVLSNVPANISTPPAPGTAITATSLTNDIAGVKYICPMPEHVAIQYDHPGKCPICGMTLVPVGEAALAKLNPGGKLLYFTCPMPEHSDVRADKTGKCPKCGMTLIPIMEAPPITNTAGSTPGALSPTNSQSQTTTTLYTCPMASHADVVADKPGKCTKCPMDLVPTSSVPHGKIAEQHWHAAHPETPNPAPPASEHHH